MSTFALQNYSKKIIRHFLELLDHFCSLNEFWTIFGLYFMHTKTTEIQSDSKQLQTDTNRFITMRQDE